MKKVFKKKIMFDQQNPQPNTMLIWFCLDFLENIKNSVECTPECIDKINKKLLNYEVSIPLKNIITNGPTYKLTQEVAQKRIKKRTMDGSALVCNENILCDSDNIKLDRDFNDLMNRSGRIKINETVKDEFCKYHGCDMCSNIPGSHKRICGIHTHLSDEIRSSIDRKIVKNYTKMLEHIPSKDQLKIAKIDNHTNRIIRFIDSGKNPTGGWGPKLRYILGTFGMITSGTNLEMKKRLKGRIDRDFKAQKVEGIHLRLKINNDILEVLQTSLTF